MDSPEPSLVITKMDGGLRVSGEIDAHTAPLLADAVAAWEGAVLRLDLSGVEFVDSSGLRVLVEAHQRLGTVEGGELRLVDTSPAVRRLFDITGVAEYLHLA